MSSTASTAGAQAQISAFGLANVFVNTKRPQKTLWRTEHVPLTHFAYADVRVDANGTARFGNRISTTLTRPADLIGEVNERYTLRKWFVGASANLGHTSGAGNYDHLNTGMATDSPPGFIAYCDDVGNAAISEFELWIGNNRFDVSDGIAFHLYDELMMEEGRQTNQMTGKVGTEAAKEYSMRDQDMIIPIQCDLFNIPGKAIESVAIHKQQIRFQITHRPLTELIHVQGDLVSDAYDLGLTNPTGATSISPNGGSSEMQDYHLQVHYVWVTSGERSIILGIPSFTLYREFQKVIELTKGASDFQLRNRMSLNNVCHDLWFAFRLDDNWDMQLAEPSGHARGYEWFNFSGPSVNINPGGGTAKNFTVDPFKSVSLNINNMQRFSATPTYLEHWMQRNHYTRLPQKFIYTYSFARHPTDDHPTGGLNLSMIDHQDMTVLFDPVEHGYSGVMLMYARCWQLMTRSKGVAHKELASQ